jgi:hypothetical protein
VRCYLAECPSLEGVTRVGGCDAGQDRRSRCFVKSLASFRSRMPSTGRDPSWDPVDFVSPVPRPHQRFWRCCNRWMTISRHPGPVCRTHPAFRASGHDLRLSFRPLTTPAVSPADTLTELGFCSLAPAAFFEARLTSVFETRCRLPTSATTYTTCGQPNPGSLDPCWDGGLDLLPVLPGLESLLRGQ